MNDQFYRSEEIRDLTYREKRLDLKSTVVLTPREKEVLKLILKEKTTNEIGEKLDVSSKTVEKHRANLFIKFGVKNVVGLVKRSEEHTSELQSRGHLVCRLLLEKK